MRSRPSGTRGDSRGITTLHHWRTCNVVAVTIALLASGCVKPAAWKLEAAGVRVTSVADGDTLTVSDSAGFPTVVRLLGIDAPEVAHDDQPAECGADTAKQALTDLVNGRRVNLLTDPGSDRTDRYGRLLAYVEATQIDDVAKQLLSHGLVIAWYPKSAARPSRADAYETTQTAAKASGVGSWAKCSNFPR